MKDGRLNAKESMAERADIPDGPGPSALERVVRIVCLGGAALAAFAVLITLAATCYSVFMRYVVGTPVTWIDELSGYLVVAIVMFGAAEALRRDDHIQVDLLTSRLTGRPLTAMHILWMLLVIVFTAVLLFSAWRAVAFSYNFGLYSDGYLEMPLWKPQSLLVVGSALILLASLAKISRALRAATVNESKRS